MRCLLDMTRRELETTKQQLENLQRERGAMHV
jgi:hypothetical protein